MALPPLVESTGGSSFLRQLLIGRVPAEELSLETLIPGHGHHSQPLSSDHLHSYTHSDSSVTKGQLEHGVTGRTHEACPSSKVRELSPYSVL